MRGFINWYFGDFKMKNFTVFLSILSFILLSIEIRGEQDLKIINPKPDPNAKDVFTELVLLKEINDGFRKEQPNYFARISSICVDDEGNLYVADGKHKTIFKFSKDGEFIKTIGREGQGPGEFMDEFMEISFGNDKKIYVVDNVRLKIIVYGKDGEFIKELKSPFFMLSRRDKVAVNRKGEIYLYSLGGLKVIDKFDSNMKLKESFFDRDILKEITFYKPKDWLTTDAVTSPRYISKVITPDDHLLVMFPYSQRVMEIDEEGNIVKDFYFRHPRFLREYKEEIKEIEKEEGFKEEGKTFYPFPAACCRHIFLDGYGNICIPWRGPIYRYSRDGKFIDILVYRKTPPIYSDKGAAFKDRFYFARGLINIGIFSIMEVNK